MILFIQISLDSALETSSKATTNLKVMIGMIMLEQSLLCYKSDITQKYSPEAS